MKNISPELCRRIGLARREKGISQSALALEFGCKQPAISMFESGDGTKLSEDVIKKLAARVGVSLDPPPVAETRVTAVLPSLEPVPVDHARPLGFCPSMQCLSNVPYVLEGRLYLRPANRMAAPVLGAKRCAVCGEVLELRCPSCGAALNEGACCAICGQPYVTPTLPYEVDAAAWAKIRREEIAALRALA